MSPSARTSLALTACLLSAAPTHAGLIAADLGDAAPQGLLDYQNPFQAGFSASDDAFARLRRGGPLLPPAALLDDSATTTDILGIVAESMSGWFFGVVDNVNSDSPGSATAQWQFDVTGFHNLTLALDMAAMGDFEASDYFLWHFAFDTGSSGTLWRGQTDESAAQTYRLSSGAEVTLNDPLMVDGVALSNNFTSFLLPLAGVGSTLTLTLEAALNGGQEALAFRHLSLAGSPLERATGVPLASTLALTLVALPWLYRRKRLR